MQIQWFPGHMGLTYKQIEDQRNRADVFIELLDARAPASTRNPLLHKLIGDKPRVIVLTKMDLAELPAIARWKQVLEQTPNTRVLLVSAKERQNLGQISQTCQELLRSIKGPLKGSLSAMIVGVPNVGKSSLINALSRANRAPVAPKPGHTQGLKKIRLSDEFELIDTPGMLWHKFDDEATGERLAMLGSIKDDVFDFHAICLITIDFLKTRYPAALVARYKLDSLEAHAPDILEAIARKRGFLTKGGGIDIERACTNLMNDFRSGAIGRISLEEA